MFRLLAIFVFFVSFYRISLYNHNFYIALLFGLYGFLLVFSAKEFRFLLRSSGRVIASIIAVMLSYSFSIDVAGSLQVSNLSNSFFIRIIAFFFLSVFPAYFIFVIYIKNSRKKLINVVFWSFSAQFVFWVFTYLIPDVKIYIYGLMGLKDSVNLYDYNMAARGFGISREINYTTPYMMALVSILIVKKNHLSFVTLPTQLINSNMVLIAFSIGLFLAKIKLRYKIITLLFVMLLVFYLGEAVFSRLYAELASGGTRTIDILLDKHFFALNSGVFEHLFGTGQYVFQGGAERNSDVGWTIMYNYGGVFFVVAFMLYLITSSLLIFGRGFVALAWLFSGIALNTKGLLFGPNAYFFMTVLLSFMSHKTKKHCW